MRNDENKKTIFLLICFSIYLSYMTIQVSILDYRVRSVVLFIVFSLLFYKLLKQYYNSFLGGIFGLLNRIGKERELNKLIMAFRKAWQFPAFLLMLSAVVIIALLLYYFVQASPYYMTGTNEGDIIADHYYTLSKNVWENGFSVLFALVCSFPILFFSILKFQEKFSLKDALIYSVLTTIIVFITLNILYKVAIFLYYTIGILLGGEQ